METGAGRKGSLKLWTDKARRTRRLLPSVDMLALHLTGVTGVTTILTRPDMVNIRRHVSSSPRTASFRFSRRVLFKSLSSPLYVHRVTFSGLVCTFWRSVLPPQFGYCRLHRSSTFREMAESIIPDGVKSRRPSLNFPNILEISTAEFCSTALPLSQAAQNGLLQWLTGDFQTRHPRCV